MRLIFLFSNYNKKLMEVPEIRNKCADNLPIPKIKNYKHILELSRDLRTFLFFENEIFTTK